MANPVVAHPIVGIVMGSTSDWDTMKNAAKMLEEFGVPYESKAMSAHRSPELVSEWAGGAHKRGMKADIRRAAEILRAGGLVAFPTETVYGLGADASNPKAVARLYSVKGRPADHPVIVHFDSIERALAFSSDVPGEARTLAERFW